MSRAGTRQRLSRTPQVSPSVNIHWTKSPSGLHVRTLKGTEAGWRTGDLGSRHQRGGDRGKSEPALSWGRPWGATGRGRVRRSPAPGVRTQAAWRLSRGPLGVDAGGSLPSSGRQTTSEVLVHTLQSKCRVQTPGTGPPGLPPWPPALASRPPVAPSPSPGSDCGQRRRTR